MRVYVNTEDKRWKQYNINFDKIANAAVGAKYKNAEVSITLVDDKEIRKINKKYRNIDKPTNVLSFELDDDLLLGDIFISIDTVKKEAAAANISVAEHTAHMVVHGILHLLGYDHIDDKDAVKMENKEVYILTKLGYKNPYNDNEFVCTNAECCPGGKTIGWLKKFFGGGLGRTLLYIIFGAIASLGFAPFYMWWWTVIGIGGAYLLSIKYLPGHSRIGKFFRIFPFGAAYAIAMFWWVLHSIYVVPELTEQLAIWTVPGIIGIGIVGGLIFGWPFLAISSMRANPVCRPFLFATVWMVVLWFREWLLTGFPWNPISNITIENMFVANSMSLYGALGLTFVIVGLIASLCEIVIDRRKSLNWFVILLFVGLGAVGIIYGVKNINKSVQNCAESTPLIRIVQPGQNATQKATHSRSAALQNAHYNLGVMMAIASAEGEYDLAVFPETAYPFVMTPGDIMSVARMLSKPIIIGSNYYRDGHLYNSLVVSDAEGTVSNVYNKSHLVPFGEYRPIGNLIPTPGQLTAGDGPEIIKLDVNGKKFVFAPAVCYEIIFSDSLIARGKTPDAIINITNDNWFGQTPGTYQHLDMVRRYAIESGLPIVRSNYSGISAFIAPNGNIIADIPIASSGHADGSVCGAHKTLYRALGRDMWLVIMLIFSCLCCLWVADMSRNRD
ncbi:MAG: apolipoprotein N-acyltransferase [Alphaproteobacteria bacterium]|nr:apolipoprotein N-acyltransferase [Alphaproteobacteria bacterium]